MTTDAYTLQRLAELEARAIQLQRSETGQSLSEAKDAIAGTN